MVMNLKVTKCRSGLVVRIPWTSHQGPGFVRLIFLSLIILNLFYMVRYWFELLLYRSTISFLMISKNIIKKFSIPGMNIHHVNSNKSCFYMYSYAENIVTDFHILWVFVKHLLMDSSELHCKVVCSDITHAVI